MGQELNRGVEQKCEAGKQSCTVINRDEAGVPWSLSETLADRFLFASYGLIDRRCAESLLGQSSH